MSVQVWKPCNFHMKSLGEGAVAFRLILVHFRKICTSLQKRHIHLYFNFMRKVICFMLRSNAAINLSFYYKLCFSCMQSIVIHVVKTY